MMQRKSFPGDMSQLLCCIIWTHSFFWYTQCQEWVKTQQRHTGMLVVLRQVSIICPEWQCISIWKHIDCAENCSGIDCSFKEPNIRWFGIPIEDTMNVFYEIETATKNRPFPESVLSIILLSITKKGNQWLHRQLKLGKMERLGWSKGFLWCNHKQPQETCTSWGQGRP